MTNKDKIQEANEEARLEYMLRNDDEYFWEYFSQEIGEAQEAIEVVKKLFEQYGYEFDIRVLEN